MTGWVAGAAALLVVRAGIHGLAGDPSPALPVTAFLLVLVVELAALSLEARMIPLRALPAAVKAVALASVAALLVAAAQGSGLVGPGESAHVWALAAAGVVGLAVTALTRQYPDRGGGSVDRQR